MTSIIVHIAKIPRKGNVGGVTARDTRNAHHILARVMDTQRAVRAMETVWEIKYVTDAMEKDTNINMVAHIIVQNATVKNILTCVMNVWVRV